MFLLRHELVEFCLNCYSISKNNRVVIDDLTHLDPFIFNCTVVASGHNQSPSRLSIGIVLDLDDLPDELVDPSSTQVRIVRKARSAIEGAKLTYCNRSSR